MEVAVDGGLERDVGIRGLGGRGHRDGGWDSGFPQGIEAVRVPGLGFWALWSLEEERGIGLKRLRKERSGTPALMAGKARSGRDGTSATRRPRGLGQTSLDTAQPSTTWAWAFKRLCYSLQLLQTP